MTICEKTSFFQTCVQFHRWPVVRTITFNEKKCHQHAMEIKSGTMRNRRKQQQILSEMIEFDEKQQQRRNKNWTEVVDISSLWRNFTLNSVFVMEFKWAGTAMMPLMWNTFELMLTFFGAEHMTIAKCNKRIGCFAA